MYGKGNTSKFKKLFGVVQIASSFFVSTTSTSVTHQTLTTFYETGWTL